MDDIDKLKELRLIQYLSKLKHHTLAEDNVRKFNDEELFKIKNILKQLLFHINQSPYIFFDQWSPFGFVIHYKIYYKKEYIFGFSEKYLPNEYDRNIMESLINGEINKSKCGHFLNIRPRRLANIDY